MEKNDKNIKIPDTVKDPISYLQYREIEGSKEWKSAHIIATSSGNIDMKMTMNRIEELIKRLDREEQQLIRKRVRAYKVQVRHVSGLKRKAYGHSIGGSRQINENLEILDERSSELLEYFGQLKNLEEVKKIIEVGWGYSITKDALNRFKTKHQDEIAKRSAEYHQEISHIRLSHKRGRLEELEYMYNKRKDIYETTLNRSDEDSMRKTLSLIQKEMEEKTILLEANIKHSIEANINIHVRQEMMMNMPINDIILARAAYKMGINPTFLIERLHSSVYSKHTGFVEPENGIDQEEIMYPSSIVYNWQQIKKMHEQKTAVTIEYEELPDEKVEEVKTLRSIIIEKLQAKKENIVNSKSRVEAEKYKDEGRE